MALNKNDFDSMRIEVKEALKVIEDKYNCEISTGNISYDDVRINMSLTFTNREEGLSAEQTYFNHICKSYNFNPSDYKKSFLIQGKLFYLVGFNPKARKNFCIIKDKNGKTFTCSPAALGGEITI